MCHAIACHFFSEGLLPSESLSGMVALVPLFPPYPPPPKSFKKRQEVLKVLKMADKRLKCQKALKSPKKVSKSAIKSQIVPKNVIYSQRVSQSKKKLLKVKEIHGKPFVLGKNLVIIWKYMEIWLFCASNYF